MAQALYRTYRPRSFDDLVGQEHVVTTIKHELESGRIAHAYLFSGPRGVGKTTTARLLAMSVNCPEGEKSPQYDEFISGRASDLIEIDAASHTGVDNVRENIIENARFTPQRAKYKVFIIDEVHMLSTSAFNALLKTLEEPPAHALFILATTEIHRVPDTIISRCQRFDFKRVAVDEIAKRLATIARQEKVEIDKAVLQEIAKRADGSVRDAEVLLTQILAISDKKITFDEASLVLPRSDNALLLSLLEAVTTGQTGAGLGVVQQVIRDGIHIPEFTKDFIELLRQGLLTKLRSRDTESVQWSKEELQQIASAMERISVADCIAVIDAFLSASRTARYSPIPQLPLELAIVTACERQQPPTDNQPPPPQSAPPVAKQKQTATKTSPSDSSGGVLKIDTVRRVWPEAIQRILDSKRSVGLTVQVGVPIASEKNQITIGFLYRFHADRAAKTEVKKIIEQTVSSLVDNEVLVQITTVDKNTYTEAEEAVQAHKNKEDTTWDEAVQVFGGEVLEEEHEG